MQNWFPVTVNPFSDPGSPGGLDLLRACDCADLKITGGKPGKIDFCNPPECIKKVPGYQGRCGEENPNIDCIPVRCATNFTDKMGLLGLKNIRTTNSWKLTEDQASFMNIPGLKAGQEFINYVQLQSEIDPKTNKKVVGCYNAKVSD